MSERKRLADVVIGERRYVLASDDDYLSGIGTVFEPHTTNLLGTLCGHEDVVVDIGANIGCTTIFLAAHAAAVHAFEPSPTTFELLRENVERAELANVHLHNVALGSQLGQAQLTFAPSNRAGGFISDKTATSVGHVTEQISVRRLDDVAAETSLSRVNFMKIDVEGFERSVLEGSRLTLERHAPTVALELNHWCLNALQRICVPDFFDYLCSIFPIVLAIEGDRFLDVRDPAERYIVMYHHINHFRYANLVAAFRTEQLAVFRGRYVQGT